MTGNKKVKVQWKNFEREEARTRSRPEELGENAFLSLSLHRPRLRRLLRRGNEELTKVG